MIYETIPSFAPEAKGLRKYFDAQFENPRVSQPERFVWDYWNIPNEYCLIRTPAFHYFPKTLYRRFHTRLVQWGRENLGCHDISPTWLSYYVDGCRQHLHRDEPHGPVAFVFSLTPWRRRKFTGGETIIGRERIPALFNQLLVFDPSLLHGVKTVRGVRDPRDARLVLHGWFVQPRVFWRGPLKAPQVGRVLDTQLGEILAKLPGHMHGFASYRLTISRDGSVQKVHLLCETINKIYAAARLRSELKRLRFHKAPGRSTLTLPMVFRN